MARLLSVNVGRPREIAWRGKTVYTSVWKEPVRDGAWCGGSTSMVTHRVIWPVTVENTALCSSTKWILTATGSGN